jgi:hypothetical protein
MRLHKPAASTSSVSDVRIARKIHSSAIALQAIPSLSAPAPIQTLKAYLAKWAWDPFQTNRKLCGLDVVCVRQPAQVSKSMPPLSEYVEALADFTSTQALSHAVSWCALM